MKTLLLTAFLSCSLLVLKAQNLTKMETLKTDSLAISQALEDYYFKGIYEGDINTLGNIFNPGTLLFGDVKGQPYAKHLTNTWMVLHTAKAQRIQASHLKGISFQ